MPPRKIMWRRPTPPPESPGVQGSSYNEKVDSLVALGAFVAGWFPPDMTAADILDSRTPGYVIQPLTAKYAHPGGACAGLGTSLALTNARSSGQAIAQGYIQDGACRYPQVVDGKMQFSFAKSDASTGGHVWLPAQGLGTTWHVAPADYAAGKEFWLQYNIVFTGGWFDEALRDSVPGGGFKLPWMFGPPPWGDGSSYLEFTPFMRISENAGNELLFIASGQQGGNDYAMSGGPTGSYHQFSDEATVGICPYSPTTQYAAPCVLMDTLGHKYEFTYGIIIRPAAADFVVTGATLTRGTNIFDSGMVGRQVYIVGDGYYRISAYTNAQSVTLDASPSAGSGKSVYISDYSNTRFIMKVDGVTVVDFPSAKARWETINANDGPGPGSVIVKFHSTSKDNTVAHAECIADVSEMIFATTEMPSKSALERQADAMAAGTWEAVSGLTGMSGLLNLGSSGASSIIPYAAESVYDSQRRQIHFIGGDHAGGTDPATGWNHVRFDIPTKTLTVLGDASWYFTTPTYADAHGYHLTAIDVVGRKLYRNPFNSNAIWAFDLDSDDTTNAANWVNIIATYPAPAVLNYSVNAMVFFPERRELLVACAAGNAFSFNVDTNTWVEIEPEYPWFTDTWQLAVYNPVLKEVLFMNADNQIWIYDDTTVDVQDRWTEKATITSTHRTYGLAGGGFTGLWTVDPVSGKYLVLTEPDNPTTGTGRNLYEYNSATDTYASATALLDKKTAGQLVACAIPHANVTAWMWAVGSGGGSTGMYLYKHD